MEVDVQLIGPSLRAERERRGLTLKQAETDTRIRTKYLAALEEERFEELPAEAYVRGFLRCYATYLGLDGARYLTAYRSRTEAAAPPIAPLPVGALRPQRRRTIPFAATLAVLVAVGLGAWKLDRDPASAGADAAPGDGVLFPQRAASEPPAPATAPAPRTAPAAVAPPALTLRAAGGDSWLEVRIGGPGGRLAWHGTLREGRTLRLGLQKALFVRAGAPHNLRATIGAQPARVTVGGYGFVATRQGIQPRD